VNIPFDLNVSRETTTLRSAVAQRIRAAIAAGALTAGQRLIERELCEQMGISRTSVREALRQLEAEGLVTTVPHKGPIVSTISVAEAEQLYAFRGLLESFAGRTCAEKHDPKIIAELRRQLTMMKKAIPTDDREKFLTAKQAFYAALLKGCDNVFIERTLNMLLNRVTLLRITSMMDKGRIRHSIAEIEEMVSAIADGDAESAERLFKKHVENAAVAALRILKTMKSETN
jgi:DNA-binding GntR family transcriptional regulator